MIFSSESHFELLLYHISHSSLYFICRQENLALNFIKVQYMEAYRFYEGVQISRESDGSGDRGAFSSFTIKSKNARSVVIAREFWKSDISELSFNPTTEELFRHSGWMRLS
jgi:hypothetical protein